jgi:hypothetical protein
MTVVAAAGSGDDRIVEVVRAQHTDDLVLVVTADRELRARCAALGASAAGASWLLGLLAELSGTRPRPARRSGRR